MNVDTGGPDFKKALVAAAIASILAACASTSVKPPGAKEARVRLTQLQSDPRLANRAPAAVQAADAAVRLAEQPDIDSEQVAYRIYIADRKVDTARAEAETRLAEDQRADLSAKREKARLDARTHELDVARGHAATAVAESEEQKAEADASRSAASAANQAAALSNEQAVEARSETGNANLAAATSNRQAVDARSAADAANSAAAASDQKAVEARSETAEANLAAANSNQQALDARSEANSADLAAASSDQQASKARSEADSADLAAAGARQRTAELEQQIRTLQARVTDRGIVVTLGDVLFTSGKSELKVGSSGNLNRLVVFLDQYPDRTATIDGYTDDRGGEASNQTLSQRRADAVKAYLVDQGVSSDRLTASGQGKSSPVARNDSAAGRQQNRRVEVTIANAPAASSVQ